MGKSFRLYVSGASKTVSRLAVDYKEFLGCLVVPKARNSPKIIKNMGLLVAADNGAFSGLDEEAFTSMLEKYQKEQVPLEWVAAPDKVCDAKTTFKLFDIWSPIIKKFGFNRALVLQNGITWSDWLKYKPKTQAVFVGGNTEFKFSSIVSRIIQDASRNGMPCHMGRVNSLKRIKYSISIGCDSCDGSGFSKWPDTHIPKAVEFIKAVLNSNKSKKGFFHD